MLSLWGARRVEQALLSHQHIRSFWGLASGHCTLPVGDLRQGASDVTRAGSPARLCLPRDRAVERKVDLECSRAVAVSRQLTLVSTREALACDADDLTWGHIEQEGASRGEVVEGLDRSARDYLAAERAQVGGERIGDALGAPAGDRPSQSVPGSPHDKPERSGEGLLQGQDRVCCQPREQGSGAFPFEHALRKTTGRADRS